MRAFWAYKRAYFFLRKRDFSCTSDKDIRVFYLYLQKNTQKKNRASDTHIYSRYSMNMLKITMQGALFWLDLKLIPSDHELGLLPCADMLIYVLCRMCILPFVVRIPIPTRSTIDDNIYSDSQLFIFLFLIMSRAA